MMRWSTLPGSRGLALLGAMAVAGCGYVNNSTAPMPASNKPARPGSGAGAGFAKFPDIPVPRGANMDMERTLVLGSQHEWIGRLALKVGHAPDKLYDFYNREMTRFGWRSVATIRAEISVLTFTRSDRVATVQISERTMSGSLVDVTVSPRDRPPARPVYGSVRIR